MAKREFLQNLRIARRLLSPAQVISSPSEADPRAQGILQGADLWLTPRSVEGFDPDDFPELSEEKRTQLSELVAKFTSVASSVSPTGPATREQAERAGEALGTILELLDHYVSNTGELGRVDQVLREMKLPGSVHFYDFDLREDSTGEPAVFVRLLLDNEMLERPDLGRVAMQLGLRIQDALAKAGLNRWAYVRFRTTGEQRALRERALAE